MNGPARTILQNNELMRHLDPASMERICRLCVVRHYARYATLFAEGDSSDAVYGVIAGRVQISARTSDGREVFLDIIEPGGLIGEGGVIDGLPRCASARAATNAQVFMLCGEHFLRLVRTDARIANALLGLFCRQRRLITRLIAEEYALSTVPARLAHRVLGLTGNAARTNGHDCTLDITQADLAKFVFVSRQVVNHWLSEWQANGWISTSRGKLVINEREPLERIAANGHRKFRTGDAWPWRREIPEPAGADLSEANQD
jgi:CRP-like cAMP-binding protein